MPDFQAQIVVDPPEGEGSTGVYHPGQYVRGQVIVLTEAPQSPISLTIAIQCTANSNRLSMLELTLHRGSIDRDQRSFPFEFECPNEPLSHQGASAAIEWSLLATLEVPLVEPIHDRSRICVLAPSDVRPIISMADLSLDPTPVWRNVRRVGITSGLVLAMPTGYLAALNAMPQTSGSLPVIGLAAMLVVDLIAVAIGYFWIRGALARSPLSKLVGRLQPEPDGGLRVDLDVSAARPIHRISVELAFENSAWDPDDGDWHVAHERFVRHELAVEGGKHGAGSVRFTLPEPRSRGLWNFETANLTSGWVVLVTVDVDGRPADELPYRIPFSVTPGPRSLT